MSGYEPEGLRALLDRLDRYGPGPFTAWPAECARVLELDGVSVSTRTTGGTRQGPTGSRSTAPPVPGRGDGGDKDSPGPNELICYGNELICYSDELSARLDDLQFTLGEGPSVEAARDGALHLVPDVRLTPHPRWPAFVPGADDLGVRSVFAFPIRLGAIRVGSLTGHRGEVRRLSEASIDAALTVCDALTHFLLFSSQAPPHNGPPGNGCRDELHRAVVHQATGMLSVDLGVSVATALDRLRAYAFAHDRPIVTVSREIVARSLQLADDRRRGPRNI